MTTELLQFKSGARGVWLKSIGLTMAFVLTVSAAGPEKAITDNLIDCLKGLPACDLSKLTPVEVRSVAEAARKRNNDRCLSGLPSCDPSRLNRSDVALFKEAR